MNIYTKLREAVERSKTGVCQENRGRRWDFIDANLLLAELKELEEEDDANRRAFAKEFDDKLKAEVDKQNQKANSEVYQPIVTLTRGFPKDFTPLPPLTKEEKGEEWWIDYLNERGLILRDKNGIAKHSDVEGFVAEARKKALEEVREMISIYARQAVNGHEAVAFDALKAWIDERFNEK